MKTIFRTEFKDHFVCLPNAMLRDRNISFRARGLLAMILSHSEEWVVTKEWAETQAPEGRLALSSAFRELEVHGYAVMVEKREKGRVAANVWTFHSSPVPATERSSFCKKRKEGERDDGQEEELPLYEKPLSRNLHSGDLHSGNQATKNTIPTEEPATEEPSAENSLPLGAAIETPKPVKTQRPRNPLFDALVSLETPFSSELTKSGAGAIGSALAQIRAATPSVTPDEIRRRAAVYRRIYPTIAFTATGLAKHWARCGDPSSGPGRVASLGDDDLLAEASR